MRSAMERMKRLRAGRCEVIEPAGHHPGESSRDYHRFCVYRDLGPMRSLEKAAPCCGLSVSCLKQLSSRFAWKTRARIWDIWERRQRRRRELASAADARQVLLQEAADWEKLAMGAVAQWIRRGADGQVELVRDLSPGEAIRLWRVGWEAERKARGYGRAEPREDRGQSKPDWEGQDLLCLYVALAADCMISQGADPAQRDDLETSVLRALASTLRPMQQQAPGMGAEGQVGAGRSDGR